MTRLHIEPGAISPIKESACNVCVQIVTIVSSIRYCIIYFRYSVFQIIQTYLELKCTCLVRFDRAFNSLSDLELAGFAGATPPDS